MKKITYFSILLILILTLSLTTFVGCGGQAKTITFEKIEEGELNNSHLEEKSESKMTFIENNTSAFSIVYSGEHKRSLTRSVDELVNVVKTMSHVTLPIVENGDENTINILVDESVEGVENDGFKIDITENKIDIVGRSDDGTRNGVYHFMEHYLGVMFVAHDDTFIPTHDNIYLDIENKVFNPDTAWRDVYSYELSQDFWSAKLKINAIDIENTDEELLTMEENNGRKINEIRQYENWGTWCHSMYSYLSPDEYFESHPEYFSMKDGVRVHRYQNIDAHLCLSNEEVYNIVRDSLAEKIAANPDVKYWDFSINDNSWVRGCECENCRALDKAAGGTGMGSLLPFINRLAREFPDKYICTLAYFHTLKPPTNIVCEDNVVIKLCSMPGDQASSYKNPTNGNAREFHDRVEAWSKICKHIVIWDYVVDFAHLLLPFPNMAVQAENQTFYKENNVEGIFHQASREEGGELVNLRAYILAKLMWEGGDMDVAHEVSRYVYAYYGAAAPHVIDYLNAIHDNMSKNTSTLGLYDRNTPHLGGYLSEKNIYIYEGLIKKALNSVEGDTTHTYRVEELLINVGYAKMLLPNISDEERQNTQSEVTALCNAHNITMTQEWQSLEEFNKNLDNEIASIRKDVSLPLYISLGVTGGILLIAILASFLFKYLSKKKPTA